MKLSISLSADDLAALDRFARAEGLASRSAAIQRAIRKLGDSKLEDAYAAAWDDWVASGDAADWEATSDAGLTDAAR